MFRIDMRILGWSVYMRAGVFYKWMVCGSFLLLWMLLVLFGADAQFDGNDNS